MNRNHETCSVTKSCKQVVGACHADGWNANSCNTGDVHLTLNCQSESDTAITTERITATLLSTGAVKYQLLHAIDKRLQPDKTKNANNLE